MILEPYSKYYYVLSVLATQWATPSICVEYKSRAALKSVLKIGLKIWLKICAENLC